MKILILARGVPNSHDPQEGCFEMDQAKALANLGHEVVVMAVDGRFRKYWRKIGLSKYKFDNVIAYKLFVFPNSVIKRLISFKLGHKINSFLTKFLYKYITKKHGEFDIVHTHYLPIIFQGVNLKELNPNLKIIGTEHWSELSKTPVSKEVKYLGDKSYSKLTRLITVSDALRKKIFNEFSVSSAVIHNLIDLKYLNAQRALNNNYTIVTVGSLNKIKGIDILIKAFYLSKLYLKGVDLKIVGDGKEYKNLLNLAKDLTISEYITFTGQLNKEQVFHQLADADLYVLSSRSENFPVAILEASAMGLPAIATLCGGVEELPLTNVTKIPKEDPEAMAQALVDAYNNRINVENEIIQKECLSYFSPEVIGKQIESLYKQVLANE